jgi:hypothetical protein
VVAQLGRVWISGGRGSRKDRDMSEAKEQHVWLAVEGDGNISNIWSPYLVKPAPHIGPYQRFRVIPDPEPETKEYPNPGMES